MQLIRKTLLLISLIFSFNVLMAQNETESLVQNIQTANFSNLLSFWNEHVEVNILDVSFPKPLTPQEANQQLQLFFSKKNIIGFEKNAERKLGNTIYVTGKLLSDQNKYNLTMLLQDSKKGVLIVSARIS